MNIAHWLAPFRIPREQVKTASYASIRLRAGALLSALSPRHRLTIGNTIPDKAEACIIGKIGAQELQATGRALLQEVERHKKRGGIVALDFTDDHFSTETPHSWFYRECLGFTDICVCSSRYLQTSIKRRFTGAVHVVPEAIEIGCKSPKPAASNPITILWFGHATNLPYLVHFLPQLAGSRPLRLIVLTSAEGLQWLEATQAPIPANVTAQCGVWSKTAMEQATSVSDVCIIPSNADDPGKAGVSSNRLITSFALGLPTCAERLDSYIEYQRYFADIRSDECQLTLDNPLRWRDLIIEAQKNVVPQFSMENIGKQWLKALGIS